jgi:hypothetical protein
MSIRSFMVGVAALVMAVPAAAQTQRGSLEFGAFASGANFDRGLTLDNGYGGGGRVGMYLDPRWSIEFEDAEMRATRTHGLKDVNVGLLSTRLVASDFQLKKWITMFVGAGAGVSTETNFLHSYGVDFMSGFKFALSDHSAFRVDGVVDLLANHGWKSYESLRTGITWYRHPDVVVHKQ